jgi:hypothetical protein
MTELLHFAVVTQAKIHGLKLLLKLPPLVYAAGVDG